MAPLTFPNEKQMVSGEGSGLAAGWGWRGARWGARGGGDLGGTRGVFCGVLKTGERRGEPNAAFPRLGFIFIVVLL